MSGHYATLLRGTVEALLPAHEVVITDWHDARMVPLAARPFDLDTYIEYLIEMFQHLGPDLHVMAVCQPAVPVFAAVALMEARGTPGVPTSMTLIGRADRHPALADRRELPRRRARPGMVQAQLHHHRAAGLSGSWRQVYPGFFQLSGFMGMNLDRHLTAHYDMFKHLVRHDGDSARSTASSTTSTCR